MNHISCTLYLLSTVRAYVSGGAAFRYHNISHACKKGVDYLSSAFHRVPTQDRQQMFVIKEQVLEDEITAATL